MNAAEAELFYGAGKWILFLFFSFNVAHVGVLHSLAFVTVLQAGDVWVNHIARKDARRCPAVQNGAMIMNDGINYEGNLLQTRQFAWDTACMFNPRVSVIQKCPSK